MEYTHISLFDHPKNEKDVFEHLIKKYKEFGTLYIGVDFDNTLYPYEFSDDESKFPKGFNSILELLQRAKHHGLKLCLWTLPKTKENLNWKIEWCRDHGIEVDYINESPLMNKYSKIFGKPHFNLLLDDVAGLESSYSILYNIIQYIEEQNKK